jgi:tellurite resistance protein TerC
MNFISNVSVVAPEYWFYFSIGILILLFIDLSLFGKKGSTHSTKSALVESSLWIMVALSFNVFFAWRYGHDLGVQFLTGYLVEKSLSVDNLFVILLVFKAFKIPHINQHKVLFYGVLGAIIMRGVFILVGAQLIQMFHWILYIFGGILVVTAIKFLKGSDEREDVTGSFAIRILKKFLPISKDLEGDSFFTHINGKRFATPLFLSLLVVEVTDLIFAVDSIPAVFAVTQDAFVAFGSNILAILGLRALYFVLADWASKLRYLKPGLAVVLGFIGVKMLIVEFYKIPSWVSLLVIFSILFTAGLSSWYVTRVQGKLSRH